MDILSLADQNSFDKCFFVLFSRSRLISLISTSIIYETINIVLRNRPTNKCNLVLILKLFSHFGECHSVFKLKLTGQVPCHLEGVRSYVYCSFHFHTSFVFIYLYPNQARNFVPKTFHCRLFPTITGQGTEDVLPMKFEVLALEIQT